MSWCPTCGPTPWCQRWVLRGGVAAAGAPRSCSTRAQRWPGTRGARALAARPTLVAAFRGLPASPHPPPPHPCAPRAPGARQVAIARARAPLGTVANRRGAHEAGLRKWLEALEAANSQLKGLGREGHIHMLRQQVLGGAAQRARGGAAGPLAPGALRCSRKLFGAVPSAHVTRHPPDLSPITPALACAPEPFRRAAQARQRATAPSPVSPATHLASPRDTARSRPLHCPPPKVLLELLKRIDALLFYYLVNPDATSATSDAPDGSGLVMNARNPNMPALDDSMLFFTRGQLTFGTGMQLKMACTRCAGGFGGRAGPGKAPRPGPVAMRAHAGGPRAC